MVCWMRFRNPSRFRKVFMIWDIFESCERLNHILGLDEFCRNQIEIVSWKIYRSWRLLAMLVTSSLGSFGCCGNSGIVSTLCLTDSTVYDRSKIFFLVEFVMAASFQPDSIAVSLFGNMIGDMRNTILTHVSEIWLKIWLEMMIL